MDEFVAPRFEGVANTFRRKRTQTSRRPKPEVPVLPENHEQASLSSTPSDEAGKVSSDENAVDANPKRKALYLNQCDGKYNYVHSNGGSVDASDEVQSGGGNGNESKSNKVKIRLKNSGGTDASRPRPKLILQDNSDEGDSLPEGKRIGLQGIPWKDFSRSGFSLGREMSLTGKKFVGKQVEKSDRSRKGKRVSKKPVLDGDFDEEDDDEIRYLAKMRTVRVAAASRDYDDESGTKHRSLARVSKGGTEDQSSLTSGKGRAKSDSVSADTDYEEEDVVSGHEEEGNKGKKPRRASPDSPDETKRGTTLTSRQRALRTGRDSASGVTQIEFPNGLPPAPSRKQKDKLTEVEQQLKKAEAAQRRRDQNAKAAKESEEEAIRKILGQDSTRKKREDKMKKRKEELAQEKAANAKMLAPNTIRTIIGPTGTTVAFAEDIGLPHIFDPRPSSYPAPREKCAGPCCPNAYKYRDSKSNLPLCSLQCYKAVHGRMQAELGC
uniref:uncharacterized protein LOC122593997 n=1 Tax=Erigeron canadensis TaxID=72917 RepID=UPI001CB8DA37|nr:uncharacterized protein LOC122593997 [Erigeron canadensis]